MEMGSGAGSSEWGYTFTKALLFTKRRVHYEEAIWAKLEGNAAALTGDDLGKQVRVVRAAYVNPLGLRCVAPVRISSKAAVPGENPERD